MNFGRGAPPEYKFEKKFLKSEDPSSLQIVAKKIKKLKEAVIMNAKKFGDLKDEIKEKDWKSGFGQNGQKISELGKNRRDFLKKVGVTVADGLLTGLAGDLAFNLIKDKKSSQGELSPSSSNNRTDVKKGLSENEKASAISKERGSIDIAEEEIEDKEQFWAEQENFKMVEDIFVNQFMKTGRIILDKKTKDQIRRYWIKQYSEGGLQHLGLTKALDSLADWYREIKVVFQEVSKRFGVAIPLNLVYLAIPESHCKLKAKSSACASGFYQLTKIAACDKSMGTCLLVNGNFDERLDPIANAQKAAELLVSWYKQIKTPYLSEEEAWTLVLTRYNGGYFNKFKIAVGKNEEKLNYENYLKFREKRINNFLQETFRKGYFEHKITEKSLWEIARKFKVSIKALKKENHLDSDIIHKGDKIKIPVNTKGKKKERDLKMIFETYLSSSMENLNYPEKFLAIWEVIEKEGLALEDKESKKKLKRFAGNGFSLKYYSKKLRVPLDSLRKVNPHILNVNIPIPKNVYINLFS